MRSQGFLNNWFNRWFNRPNPTPTPDPNPDPNPDPTPPPSTDFSETLLRLHNGARRSVLSINAKLTIAAQKHAEWMARNNIMSHTGAGRSSFDQRIKNEGYRMQTGGENVAAGYNSAESVFNGWMKSPGHHANIVNTSFKEVGFGMAISSNGTKYWCTDFGTQFSGSMSVLTILPEFLPGPLTGNE